MGLDMYLSSKKYLSKYYDETDSAKIASINEMFGVDGQEDNDYCAKEITFRVAYWRKANAIHEWFVKNCQGGVDNCQEYWINREDLENLAGVCREVLADKSKASELLPTQSGFFFGGTDYDEFYFQDLQYTVARLDKILNDPALAKMDFYYQASW